jgi:hypothetical protein
MRPASCADDGALKALTICHYIWGALTILISSLFLAHVLAVMAIARGSSTPGPLDEFGPVPSQPIGYVFAVIGGCTIVFGWIAGVATIISGRGISARRDRVWSLVVAAVNCCFVPIGTVLGVLTLIMLTRPSVMDDYARRAH